jgi:hypothetical protein
MKDFIKETLWQLGCIGFVLGCALLTWVLAEYLLL